MKGLKMGSFCSAQVCGTICYQFVDRRLFPATLKPKPVVPALTTGPICYSHHFPAAPFYHLSHLAVYCFEHNVNSQKTEQWGKGNSVSTDVNVM